MNPDLRYQLKLLDASIFNLLDERARLMESMSERPQVAIDDILARHEGQLSAESQKELASAIDAAFGAGASS